MDESPVERRSQNAPVGSRPDGHDGVDRLMFGKENGLQHGQSVQVELHKAKESGLDPKQH